MFLQRPFNLIESLIKWRGVCEKMNTYILAYLLEEFVWIFHAILKWNSCDILGQLAMYSRKLSYHKQKVDISLSALSDYASSKICASKGPDWCGIHFVECIYVLLGLALLWKELTHRMIIYRTDILAAKKTLRRPRSKKISLLIIFMIKREHWELLKYRSIILGSSSSIFYSTQ